MCGSKKPRFIRDQEARGLLSAIVKNFNTWSVINMIIDKTCCNPNVLIRIIAMIMDSPKSFKISYDIKQV